MRQFSSFPPLPPASCSSGGREGYLLSAVASAPCSRKLSLLFFPSSVGTFYATRCFLWKKNKKREENENRCEKTVSNACSRLEKSINRLCPRVSCTNRLVCLRSRHTHAHVALAALFLCVNVSSGPATCDWGLGVCVPASCACFARGCFVCSPLQRKR